MSLPRLRFRLVDDTDRVLFDEEVWLDQAEDAAERHGEINRKAVAAGRTTRLYVTDPDGDIAPVAIVSKP